MGNAPPACHAIRTGPGRGELRDMKNETHEEEPTLIDYLEILHRRKYTVAAVAGAFFALMALYAFGSTPVYQASALLDLEKAGDLVRDTGYQPPDEAYIPTQAKLIVSESALRRVYEDLRLSRTDEFARFQSFRDAVSVLGVPRTRLCYVNAESVDPKLAVAISSELAHNFVAQNLNNQLFMPKTVLAELDTRARGPYARRFYESLPAVINNVVIQEMKKQILLTQAQLAELKAKYTDDHPDVQAVKSQLALLEASRNREIDRVVRSFRTELSGQFRPNNVRVVDDPVLPQHPVRPRKRLALALGLVGGLVLGGLAALGLETIDQTIRTHDDVERRLGLPLLGHIPLARVKAGQRVYSPLLAPEASLPSEAFRNLRTMVVFAKAADADPFLLVTSAVQQEGKSFVAANLAVALSQLGQKVLLVDGDLRRPSQDVLLGVPMGRGLGDFLAGRAKEPGELPQATEVPNLSLVAAGARLANPAELLSAGRLADFVDWARARFDRVVVDCPPVFPVSDVLLWGRHARSSIIVSRSGRTRLPLIRTACARLRAGGMDILGGVINGTPVATMRDVDGRGLGQYFGPPLLSGAAPDASRAQRD